MALGLHSSCRIDFCAEAASEVGWDAWWARVFCIEHSTQFMRSAEGTRCRVARDEGRLTQSLFVAALCDFRTRVELEHRRDQDLDVRRARKGGA